MAASALAAPGTDFGPCEGICTHQDCAGTREMAETKCRYCGEIIGYDQPFYQHDSWADLSHQGCHLEAIGA